MIKIICKYCGTENELNMRYPPHLICKGCGRQLLPIPAPVLKVKKEMIENVEMA